MQTVDQQIASIKANMPQVYQAIQARAQAVGKVAFAFVRRGLRGEANCFYAFERGHVVGTPFNRTDVMPTTAYYMVAFGCDHIVIWWDDGQPIDSQHPPIGTPTTPTHAGNSTPAVAPVAGLGKSERCGEHRGAK